MEIWETSVFTKQITQLMTDAQYKELQSVLVLNQNVGDVIRYSGGLRKLRWRIPGSGKRGGIRVIYYNVTGDTILMLFAYKKNQVADLTRDQVDVLRQMAKSFSPKR